MLIDTLMYFKDKMEYLYRLGNEINETLYVSPQGAVVKGRLFAEQLSKEIAKVEGVDNLIKLTQIERLRKLNEEGIIANDIDRSFCSIRKLGNIAVHDEIEDDLEAALSIHRNLYKIICWYIETYIDYELQADIYITPKLFQPGSYKMRVFNYYIWQRIKFIIVTYSHLPKLTKFDKR